MASNGDGDADEVLVPARNRDGKRERDGASDGGSVADPHCRKMVCEDEYEEESWRQWFGKHVVGVQQTIDGNLTLFRLGCFLALGGSIAAGVRLSGVLRRFNNVDEIPMWWFARNKKLRVRMIYQCENDPNVFYVYHTPFIRRIFLQDTLPKNLYAVEKNRDELLAVRAFGVQVDESAKDWIWSNFVSSHRYMTLQLLHKLTAADGHNVATCNISLRMLPFSRDFAQELVSLGHAEWLPESTSNFVDESTQSMKSLVQRLQKLEALQKHAQMMQYGIWKDWEEDKLKDRVVSAGRRAATRGVQKLIDKIRP